MTMQHRRLEDLEGTSIDARLGRIEDELRDLKGKFDLFAKDEENHSKAIRELQDWRIEMTVYMRQLRWTLIVAIGALIAGGINILLELAKHA